MATRPVELFFLRVGCAASRTRKFADVGEKATKPIKVQSVLIAPLIFDLRERAHLLVQPVDRDSQPGGILRYCDAVTPMAIGPSDSLLISSGFVVFERISAVDCTTTRELAISSDHYPPSASPHRTRRIVFQAM